jgi:predicted outer membrane lipoprotein
MRKIQIVIRIGPNNPMSRPLALKSLCCSLPVLNAMAFGGVDMGNNKAQEALKPIIRGMTIGFCVPNRPAIGMRIVAVAVLLIILEKTTVRTPKRSDRVQKLI